MNQTNDEAQSNPGQSSGPGKHGADLDLDSLADQIVNTCTRVRRGEVVQLGGGIHNFSFLAALALAVRRAGAIPELNVTSDDLQVRTMTEIPLDLLQIVPEHRLRWLDDVDAMIVTDAVADPSRAEEVPEDRRAAVRYAGQVLEEKMLARQIRWTYVAYPTPEMAAAFGIPYEELASAFWSSLAVDYEELADRCLAVQKALTGVSKVHITSEQGTDLVFHLGDRPVLADDGIISDSDLEQGDVGNNLPAGEVFTAPLEASAEGTAVFSKAYRNGRRIENLRLTFAEGKVQEAEADLGMRTFRQVLAYSQGDCDRLGEFGVGLNPAAQGPLGLTFTDEKIAGSIHLALGENRPFGGTNESSLHWDLVMLRPTVTVDGRPLMVEGALRV